MAAGIALQLSLPLALELEVRSAGTRARPGLPAEPRVVAVCREVGIDLSEHRSQPLSAESVAWADRIAVMEEAHALAVRALLPEQASDDRVVALGPLVGRAFIADPIGSWFHRPYRRTRDELFVAVRRLLQGL